MTVRVEDSATPAPAIETQVVDTPVVACDGNGPGLGHPRIFLTFGSERDIVCPYCSRRYVLAEGAKAHGH